MELQAETYRGNLEIFDNGAPRSDMTSSKRNSAFRVIETVSRKLGTVVNPAGSEYLQLFEVRTTGMRPS